MEDPEIKGISLKDENVSKPHWLGDVMIVICILAGYLVKPEYIILTSIVM